MSERKKLVIVGDGNCGKTLMLMVLQNGGVVTTQHSATVFETYVHTMQVDGRKVEMQLADTAGQEDYSRIRLLGYKNADVVVLVYSISEPDTFDNVVAWKKEVSQMSPKSAIILVGNKTDLRDDPDIIESLTQKNSKPVSEMDGRAMKEKINAVEFFECSAKHNVGIQEVFQSAAKAALIPKVAAKKTGKFQQFFESNCNIA